MAALSIEHVTKAYTGKLAVDDVSFEVKAGCLFGLLGPNGAGKTSLIRMINRITLPDNGTILLDNQPLTEKQQAHIGYMPEERGMYRKMPINEQLRYLLQLKGMTAKAATEAIDYWLVRLELADWKNRRIDELSKGMQQKIQFILTIAHKPKLLILDEPFSGLDPVNALVIEQIMHELKAQGTTILFSTHRMEQAEQLCERIALINQGKLVLESDVFSLRRASKKNRFTLETIEPNPEIPEALITVLKFEPHTLIFSLNDPDSQSVVLAWFNERYTVIRFEQYLPGLREIFIEQVGGVLDPI